MSDELIQDEDTLQPTCLLPNPGDGRCFSSLHTVDWGASYSINLLIRGRGAYRIRENLNYPTHTKTQYTQPGYCLICLTRNRLMDIPPSHDHHN